jgi:signal peptidase I
MKKKLLITLTVLGLLVIIGAIVYLTRAIEIYAVSTTSNQPTLKNGGFVVASRLKKPKKNTFIAFEKDKYFWLFRCIAEGGDVIEMKNAVIYVNGKMLNEPYTMKEYQLPTKDILAISDYITKNNIATREIYYGTSLIAMSDEQFKSLNKSLKPFAKAKGAKADDNLFPGFAKKGFNEDNLGPIKVPANSYFVLGDDRHNAFDSRYFGFVKASEVVSTVMF